MAILSDREIETREFGSWATAHRLASESADTLDDKLMRLMRGTSEGMRQTVLGLVAARRAV